MSAFTSEIGTNRTCRGGLTMSVYRGRPEVIGARSKRRDWTRNGHSPVNHRPSGSGGGDGLQRYLNPSSRPCASPRRDERGLPAETTELCCGHTCRMPPVCGRRPSPMLPSLPLGAQADQAPPRTSGRSLENRDTSGSTVSMLRSKPGIHYKNIDRTQCATNVLPDMDRGGRA